MDRLALAVTGKFNKIGPQRSCPCAHLLHKGQQFGAFALDAQYLLPRAASRRVRQTGAPWPTVARARRRHRQPGRVRVGMDIEELFLHRFLAQARSPQRNRKPGGLVVAERMNREVAILAASHRKAGGKQRQPGMIDRQGTHGIPAERHDQPAQLAEPAVRFIIGRAQFRARAARAVIIAGMALQCLQGPCETGHPAIRSAAFPSGASAG